MSEPGQTRFSTMKDSTDILTKDVQIKMLKEQLEFVQKQLEEKDRQLEHYKGLVKTFQDLLSEVSGLKSLQPRQPISPPEPTIETALLNSQQASIRGRKSQSFHEDAYPRKISAEGVDSGENSADSDSNWRHISSHQARIRKSSSVAYFAPPKEESTKNSLSVGRSTPNVAAKSKAPNPTNSKNLKKSVSMTSLEENRFDLKFPDLDQMIGQIYALSKYQQGCRFLQKKLDENNPMITRLILEELREHLVELMTDPFGNYLFTKLMEQCDENQREEIVKKILPDLIPTAIDMYGTQSLQKMIPFLTKPQVMEVVKVLSSSTISLVKHNKANYLIQYFLDHLEPDQNQWIYDAVVESLDEVSRDRVGCVIVKRCIDHAIQQQRDKILDSAVECCLTLVQDPFGNYVIQHILEQYPPGGKSSQLIRALLGSLTELCVQKFSSNVVEKCLQVADKETCRLLLDEIINSEVLPQLLNDRFANFVIQTALDVAEEDQHGELVRKILPHLGKHFSPYTKRLQKKILQV